jgi:thioredoxin reductase (NADPH)
VFALTGYFPSTRFLEQLGVRYDPDILLPQFDPETFETNVPGVYLAGSVVAGRRHKEIFIENGRFHGASVMRSIAARRE